MPVQEVKPIVEDLVPYLTHPTIELVSFSEDDFDDLQFSEIEIDSDSDPELFSGDYAGNDTYSDESEATERTDVSTTEGEADDEIGEVDSAEGAFNQVEITAEDAEKFASAIQAAVASEDETEPGMDAE